ncbi:MAG: hypothetical protein A2W31_14945 [Planctomycetes bacterium RBG_16_64_10]|nr:MAG: hypothetical protein A2W31_14945 [Planctomycetes bacterium RBG_16_64_10]
MVSCTKFSSGTLGVLVALCATPAPGQRVQFPTMVSDGAGGGAVGTAPAPATPPSTALPPATMPAPALPPGQTAPSATFGGSVQPVPGWDPYGGGAAPGSAAGAVPYYTPPPTGPTSQPPALFPEGVPWSSSPGGYAYPQPAFQMPNYQRFLQEVRFEFTWLPSNGGENRFGLSGAEVFGTFAFPLFGNADTPLLVTPGVAFNFLDGPVTTPENQADMPAQLYDAYLDFAWQPRVTPWFSGDLGFRTGVYSDFSFVDTESIRLMGRGLGVITFTPTMQATLGVVYLDRNKVKLLPAGGLIWTPNPNRRWEIVFPNPKLANRCQDIGTTELWWYVSGEYGGGAWTVTRSDPVVDQDSVDYNDIRAILGLEWTTLSRMNGFFEIGYVFEREIVYVSQVPVNFNPDDTIMLRAGLAF